MNTFADIRNRLAVVHGDITTQQVDAVVNAAGPSLLGGYNLPAKYIIQTVGPIWVCGWFNSQPG
jgi:O-acetyl-ADP-ribose deacetylase (regulator of RNase III)